MSEGDDGIAPGEELQLLRSAELDWTHLLAERLEEAEIPHQVKPVGERRATNSQWALYVRAADLERAMAVDREVMHEVMPDIPENFDPSATDTSQCPACGESVTEGATECAECGLALLVGG
jgi:hypothetical protein